MRDHGETIWARCILCGGKGRMFILPRDALRPLRRACIVCKGLGWVAVRFR
jgi:hypothetical protein